MKLLKKQIVKTATIEFDNEELEFLAALMTKIGGVPEGVRGIADRLNNVLESLGYDFDEVVKTKAYCKMDIRPGNIYFHD